jgi:hypothetical protein
VLYGGPRRLTLRGDQFLTQDTPGIAGDGAEEGDEFSWSLAAGDLTGDRRDELVLGVPLESVAAVQDGAAHVLYGGSRRLSLRGDRFLTQETGGMEGDGAGSSDQFGFSLGLGDFDADGRQDLAIDELQTHENCANAGGGAVHVLYGAHEHFAMGRDQFLTQDTPGMAGDGSQPCDAFGFSLSTGPP